jgi:hypothetical protein
MTAMLLPAGSPSVELSFMVRVVAEYLADSVPAVLSDADLVAELRGRETVRRQLEAADHVLIAELDRRGLGAACGARSTAGLLSSAFRLSPRDASDRVTAARHLGHARWSPARCCRLGCLPRRQRRQRVSSVRM